MPREKVQRIREGFSDYSVYDFLGSIATHWLPILFLSFVMALGAFMATIVVVSREYSTRATLLVVPTPEVRDEGGEPEPPAIPLSPRAYQQLLLSPQLVKRLQQATGSAVSKVPLEEFDDRLSVSVLTQKERLTTVYAPVIDLTVRGDDAELCQRIANLWADLATSESLRIRNAELVRVNELIHEQFLAARESLEEAEAELEEFDAEAALDLRAAQLTVAQEEVADANRQVDKMRVELASLKAQRDQLRLRYDGLVASGAWETVDAVTGQPEAEDPFVRQILSARRNLTATRSKRADFRATNNPALKGLEHKRLEEQLAELELEQMRDQIFLQGAQAKIGRLDQQIEEQPLVNVLRKAITDDALWQSIMSKGGDLSRATERSLATEILNPVSTSLREERAMTDYLIENRRASIEQRGKQIEAVQKRLEALNEENARLEEELQSHTLSVERAQVAYVTVFELVIKTLTELSQTEGLVQSTEAQVAAMEKQAAQMAAGAKELGAALVRDQVKRERFNRTVEVRSDLFQEVAEKDAAARIADIEKAGDLRVGFYAPRPEKSLANRRRRNYSAAVFFLTFAAASIFFALSDRMRSIATDDSGAA